MIKENMLGVDCTVLPPESVLKTSGHVERFCRLSGCVVIQLGGSVWGRITLLRVYWGRGLLRIEGQSREREAGR